MERREIKKKEWNKAEKNNDGNKRKEKENKDKSMEGEGRRMEQVAGWQVCVGGRMRTQVVGRAGAADGGKEGTLLINEVKREGGREGREGEVGSL